MYYWSEYYWREYDWGEYDWGEYDWSKYCSEYFSVASLKAIGRQSRPVIR